LTAATSRVSGHWTTGSASDRLNRRRRPRRWRPGGARRARTATECPPLQEAHDGERARAEVDAAGGVHEVELRAGHGDEGLLGGGRRRRGVLVLFRLREEVLGELVGVHGGVQRGRGGEEGGVEVRVGLLHLGVQALALLGSHGGRSSLLCALLWFGCCGAVRIESRMWRR
jgi:hypothetical protein